MSVVRAVARASRHVAKSQTNINISISIRLFIDVSGLNLLDSVQAAATLLNTPYSNVLKRSAPPDSLSCILYTLSAQPSRVFS
jgi:hypothetical protein